MMNYLKKEVTNPIPVESLESECGKAAKILKGFCIPAKHQVDKFIPPYVIQRARGLAILSVIKGGFMFSGRMGAGVVISRLDDGGWSAPACIGTGGVGWGFQIGAELADFVIVLNTKDAVKAFSRGNVTLGGNLSVAAGPIGRNAEAAAAVTLAAVFSYSRTRGLFAGISLEGSVIVERKDCNHKFYGHHVTTSSILSGAVSRPQAAKDLYECLHIVDHGSKDGFTYSEEIVSKHGDHSHSHSHGGHTPAGSGFPGAPPPSSGPYGHDSRAAPAGSYNAGPYGNAPPPGGYPPQGSYAAPPGSYHPDQGYQANYDARDINAPPGAPGGYPQDPYAPPGSQYGTASQGPYAPQGSQYGAPPGAPGGPPGAAPGGPGAPYAPQGSQYAPPGSQQFGHDSRAMDGGAPTYYPPQQPPSSVGGAPIGKAKALYNFDGADETELSFKFDDIITIWKQHGDWWEGEKDGRRGLIPANYVELTK